MIPILNRKKDIILFDGICNFCNSYINYVISHDEDNRFVFAPLQSDVAKELSVVYQIDLQSLNSIVVLHNKRVFTRSDGIIHIAKHLKSKWSWLFFIIEFIPQSIRNYGYTLIADRRYNWFGQMNSCMVPTQEVRDKFLA
jgi:predicted DCC family thiol-disulfide oxidoreductase YuxK